MPEMNFVDRSFSKDITYKYHLSIQADRSGLAYCLLDSRHGDFILFRKYKFDHVYMTSDLVRQVIAVFDRDDILNQPFLSVHFMGYSQQSTLVPVKYFSPHHLSDYIKFNLGIEPDGELFNNLIQPLNNYNIFVLPRSLVSLVTLHFKKVEFSSQATPFLLNLSSGSDSLDVSAIHIGLNTDFFDIAVTGSGKLLLYNTFQFVNETDLLYYVLFVCKQLSLIPGDVSMTLSGELSSRLAYFEILKQYLPAAKYDAASGIPPLASALLPVSTYKYLNLFNLHACALSAETIKAV
jgi:hypothetical protein